MGHMTTTSPAPTRRRRFAGAPRPMARLSSATGFGFFAKSEMGDEFGADNARLADLPGFVAAQFSADHEAAWRAGAQVTVYDDGTVRVEQLDEPEALPAGECYFCLGAITAKDLHVDCARDAG